MGKKEVTIEETVIPGTKEGAQDKQWNEDRYKVKKKGD